MGATRARESQVEQGCNVHRRESLGAGSHMGATQIDKTRSNTKVQHAQDKAVKSC
jgi:hypothetical protein